MSEVKETENQAKPAREFDPLVTVWRFDEHGYYDGEDMAQELEDGSLILAEDCVTVKPECKPGYWYEISDDKKSWKAIKKPTTAAECVGIYIEHEDQSNFSHECRSLFEELCAASGGTYQVVRDEDDLCLTVEAVPEPTAEEIAADEAEQELQDFDSQLQDIKDRMAIAQLSGNTELIAQLQQEYSELMAV